MIDTTSTVAEATENQTQHKQRLSDLHPHGPGEPCPGGCSDITDFGKRLTDGDTRMDRIEVKLDANSTATAEILDILTLGKSFFRVIGYFGSFMKWFAAIAAPVLVFWYTIKNGGKV